MKLDHILPSHENLVDLKETGASPSYPRSIWLGLSQAVLNLPRLLLVMEARVLFKVVLDIATAVVMMVLSALAALVSVIGLVALGFAGRLASRAEAEAAGLPFKDQLYTKMTDASKAKVKA